MRIPSGTVDQVIYFKAVDSTDLKTPETGLTSFTVYRSRNTTTATAMTTPTVTEVSAANMPGVYTLLLDEDMTIAAGNTSEEMAFHITQASMAPVTRVIELYRPSVSEGGILAAPNSTVDFSFTKGATSQTALITIRDVWGNPLTGLVFNSAGLTAYYARPLGTPTAITLATLAAITTAWSSGGFKEADATNMPGVYRVDIPNAVLATGVENAKVVLKGAANMQQFVMNIELLDPVTTVGGLVEINWGSAFLVDSGSTYGAAIAGSAVKEIADNAAAAGIASLTTRFNSVDSYLSGVDIAVANVQTRLPTSLTAGGKITASVDEWLATAVAAPTVAGVPEVDVTHWGGTAISTAVILGAANIAANAINAAKLDPDVTTELQTGLATAANLAIVAAAVDTEIPAILAAVDTEIAAILSAIAALNNLSAAAINAELLDVLVTDTFAEPTAVPAATASLKDKIGWICALARNKFTQSATTFTLQNDGDTLTIGTAVVSDSGSLFTRNKYT